MAQYGDQDMLARTICMLEQAYGTAPLLSPSFSVPGNSISFTQTEIDQIHAVFIYAISPFIFKRCYKHEDLNGFAQYVDLLPRNGDTFFEPERHSAKKEEQCCRLIAFVQHITVFAFDSMKKGHLDMLVGRIFQDKSDVQQCINNAREVCAHIFGGAMCAEKTFIALFVIVLAIVHDKERFKVITSSFKHQIENLECIERAKQAKNFVKSMMYEDALKTYKEILKIRSFDHFIYGNLAQVYLSLDKYMYAEWCAQRAIVINPKWPKSHYRWIRAVECQGNIQKAFEISSAVSYLAGASPDFFIGDIDLLTELHCQQQELYIKALHLQVSTIENEKKPKQFPRQRSKASGPPNSSSGGWDTFIAKTPLVPSSNSEESDSKVATDRKQTECGHSESSVTSEAPEAVSSKSNHAQNSPYSNDDKSETKDTLKTLLSGIHQKQDIAPVSAEVNGSDELVKVPSKKKSKAAKKRGIIENYISMVKSGSEALILGNFKLAYHKYSMALDTYTEKGLKGLGISLLDIILLKYCFSLTCIGKATYEDIELGLKTLHEIIDDHYDVSFPLAYYGKARCFTTLNRYNEAKDPLEKLKNIIRKKIKLEIYEFPCCDGTIIEESQPGKLKDLVDDLVATCNVPPLPNAICRNACEKSHYKREIYYNDPDFQGYTELVCRERCHLQYHPNCWREMKEDCKLSREKDFLGKRCMTPDCNSVIVRIELYGADGVLRKMFPAEVDVKPKVKEQSQVKPASKFDAKKVSRPNQRRYPRLMYDNTGEDDQSVGKLPGPLLSEGSSKGKKPGYVTDIDNSPDTRKDALAVFKKLHSDNTVKVLEKKLHQKKLKQKQLLLLEFTNSDASRIQQLKSFKEAVENENQVNNKFDQLFQRRLALDPVVPFAVPSVVRDDFALEKWLQALDGDGHKERERIEENLIEYLENYLKTNGPTSLTSRKFLTEVADFPSEAEVALQESGGIKKFLLNSRRFEFISDILLLPKHFYILTWNSASLLWVLDLAVQGCNRRNALWENNMSDHPIIKALSLPLLFDSCFPSFPNDYDVEYAVSIDESLYDMCCGNASGDATVNSPATDNNYSVNNNSSCSSSFSESILNHSGQRRSTSVSTSTDVSEHTPELDKRKSNYEVCHKGISDKRTADVKTTYFEMQMKGSKESMFHGAGELGTGRQINTLKSGVAAAKTASLQATFNGHVPRSVPEQIVNCSLNKDDFNREFFSLHSEVPIDGCCPLCSSEEVETLKKKYRLTTEECQELKDKLMQKQNEFQVLKSAQKRELDDKEECYRKLQKRYDVLQSNHDKLIKQFEADRSKNSREIKTQSDKIKALLTEKQSIASELKEAQLNFRKLVSFGEEQQEVEKRLRLEAEDELKTVKDTLEATEANFCRVSTNELVLTDKVKNLETQISNLNKKFALEHMLHQQPRNAFIEPLMKPMPQPRWLLPTPSHYIPGPTFSEPFLGHIVRLPPPSPPEAFQNSRHFQQRRPTFAETGISEVQKSPLHNESLKSRSASDLSLTAVGMLEDKVSALANAISTSREQGVASLPSVNNSPTKQITQILKMQGKLSKPIKDSYRKVDPFDDDVSLPLTSAAKKFISFSYADCAATIPKKNKVSGSAAKFGETLEALQKEFPTMSYNDFVKCISEIRSRHNKTLSGMRVLDIIEEAKDLLRIKKKPSGLKSNPSSMGLDKFDEVPLAWNVVPEAKTGSKRYGSEECYICYDKMDESNSHQLACGHVYHNFCIEPWFDRNSTCPICRYYAPLPKEYPPLQ